MCHESCTSSMSDDWDESPRKLRSSDQLKVVERLERFTGPIVTNTCDSPPSPPQSTPSSSLPPCPHHPILAMAPKPPCAKYQYVVTHAGPKILPVDEPSCKDEESPADYNAGGYLPVKVNDTFCSNRYRVVRKLGYR